MIAQQLVMGGVSQGQNAPQCIVKEIKTKFLTSHKCTYVGFECGLTASRSLRWYAVFATVSFPADWAWRRAKRARGPFEKPK